MAIGLERAGAPRVADRAARMARMRCMSLLCCLSTLPTLAHADPTDKLPPLAIAARETFDAVDVLAGANPGAAILNKLQISGTLRGDQFGLNGWLFHAQLIRFDGQSVSRRLGDLQTSDNIEAVPANRLFEAYFAKTWGEDQHSVALRAGLIDLNSQFDSIDQASLMLNSSHGIGPDLSRSGRNGPSIYPVTAFGSTLTWVRSPQWTFRLGVFDGVAGSPSTPHAFFAERLSPSDGVLVIGQADYQLDKDRRIEGGVWGYSAAQPGPSGRNAHDRGAYLSYERRSVSCQGGASGCAPGSPTPTSRRLRAISAEDWWSRAYFPVVPRTGSAWRSHTPLSADRPWTL